MLDPIEAINGLPDLSRRVNQNVCVYDGQDAHAPRSHSLSRKRRTQALLSYISSRSRHMPMNGSSDSFVRLAFRADYNRITQFQKSHKVRNLPLRFRRQRADVPNKG